MSIGTALAGGRQLATMGALPYFGVIAAATFIVGAGFGGWVAYKWQAGRVAEARADLKSIRADIRTAAADGEAEAAKRQLQANVALQASQDAITAAVAAIPSQVAARIAGPLRTLREALDAPEYACLDIPMPADSLGVLRRPGSGDQGGGSPDSGQAAGGVR